MSDNKLDIPQPLMDGLDIVAKSANNDRFFLHKVCMNKNVTLEIVQHLLKVNPAAASHPTKEFDWGYWDEEKDSTAYPIHLACCNEQCPSSVIKLLVQIYPIAIKHFCSLDKWKPHPEFHEHNLYGLPLTYYLSRTDNVDIETVRMLVRAYPQALIDDNNGRDDTIAGYFPIFMLLNNPNVSQMADIVQYIVGVCPDSLDQIAGYGVYPLHIACANKNIDAKIIRIILDASDFAQVDYTANNPPHLPIHSLCANRDIDDVAALDVLRLLLNRYPEWVREGTDDGYLPLHCAVGDGNRSPEFCKILVDAYPESVAEVAEDFHYRNLPIHEACRAGRLETVVPVHSISRRYDYSE